jgi:DNA mismatch endonuclease (patch repair protein)
MASIRGADTKPELALRAALWADGVRGYRCNWRGPSGRIDVAFTRWKVAVFVDGLFWHGHPSKWQPGRWAGYWDEKIKRNIARDARQNAALADAGWTVLRFWETEIDQAVALVVERVKEALELARASHEIVVRPADVLGTPFYTDAEDGIDDYPLLLGNARPESSEPKTV